MRGFQSILSLTDFCYDISSIFLTIIQLSSFLQLFFLIPLFKLTNFVNLVNFRFQEL